MSTVEPPAGTGEVASAPDLLASRYRVSGAIGQGGMGAVFDGYDETLKRPVALKLLHPELTRSSAAVARFGKEAEYLAAIDCPHVVRVFDAGIARKEGDDRVIPFIALERLRGDDLWTFVRKRSIGKEKLVELALQLCEALAAIHSTGLVHNDVKPENVVVCEGPDGEPFIKLIDLGIACRAGERAAAAEGGHAGSPGYISPERLCGDPGAPDPRSDVWSLGVILYELLALRPPFPGQTPTELCAQVLAATVVPLVECSTDVCAELDAVVQRCMARNPEDRFADVGEVADALSPFAGPRGAELACRVSRRLDRQSLAAFPLLRVVAAPPLAAGADSWVQ